MNWQHPRVLAIKLDSSKYNPELLIRFSVNQDQSKEFHESILDYFNYCKTQGAIISVNEQSDDLSSKQPLYMAIKVSGAFEQCKNEMHARINNLVKYSSLIDPKKN